MGRSKRYKVRRDFSGELIRLTLVKLRDYAKFSLYQVVKVVDDKEIPLYAETFTPEQVEAFYNNPTYYEVV